MSPEHLRFSLLLLCGLLAFGTVRTQTDAPTTQTTTGRPKTPPTTASCIDGSTWKRGPCLECTCANGKEQCIAQSCPQPKCDNPVTPEGQCCAECKEVDCSTTVCTLQVCEEGMTPVLPPGKCCKQCTNCTTVTCKEPACSNPTTPDNQCCPVCPDCSRIQCDIPVCANNANPITLPGECCPSCPLDCSTVRCASPVCLKGLTPVIPPGKCCAQCTDCSTVRCKKPVCSNSTTPFGQCCPVCPGCTDDKGEVHPEGSSWKKSSCEKCMCENGREICSTPICVQPPCDNPVQVDGQCCPTCKNAPCKGKDGVHPHGSSWKPSACSGCRCDNGREACYIMDCARLQCQNPVTPKGQCCPICKEALDYCMDDQGKRRKDGDVWEEKCHKCQCKNGKKRCGKRSRCGDCIFSIYTGKCCPKCLVKGSGRPKKTWSFNWLSQFFGY